MAEGGAPDDRNAERREYSSRDVFHRFAARRAFTLRKVAQDNAGEVAQFTRLLQMHERAVHLPGLHAAVFEDKQGAAGIEFPRRAESGFDKRETAAKKNAL